MFHRRQEAAWYELNAAGDTLTVAEEGEGDDSVSSDSDSGNSYDYRLRHGRPSTFTPSALGQEWSRAYDVRGKTPLTLHATVVGDAGISQLCNLTNHGLSSGEQVFR